MGYLTKSSATPQDNNASRVLNGVAGTVAIGSAGGLAAMMPETLETFRTGALRPMHEGRLVGPLIRHQPRGSEARRFLAQEKSMLRHAQKAMQAGDTARATKLTQQLNSPMHRAWRGFKSMRLPGKLKLLAPVLGTAAGAVGLGTAGVLGLNKALNG